MDPLVFEQGENRCLCETWCKFQSLNEKFVNKADQSSNVGFSDEGWKEKLDAKYVLGVQEWSGVSFGVPEKRCKGRVCRLYF